MCVVLIVFGMAKVHENGDFIGYVNAGNLVLSGGDIYSDMFNTWPPAFSILSVPFALLNNISFIGVRIIWMLTMFILFFYCMKCMLNIIHHKRYSNKEVLQQLQTPVYFTAFFLCCRAFMDNLIYMQINILMLAACCYLLNNINRRNDVAGWLAGVSIGAKVFNIFLLPAYILFRQWRMVAMIMGGIALTLVLCWVVFGIAGTEAYFSHWYHHIASAPQTIEHRNQSLICALNRLLSADNQIINEFPSLTDWSFENIQKLYYALLLSGIVLFLTAFRQSIAKAHPTFMLQVMVLIITLIPVLSPVSWKANYIYALPAFFLMAGVWSEHKLNTTAKILFIFGSIFLVLSNEALIGRAAMYFLENCNVLVAGELLLAFALVSHMLMNQKQERA